MTCWPNSTGPRKATIATIWRFAVAAALACGAVLSFAPTLRAEITAEQVRKAIERGVAYLKVQQRVDGSWSDIVFGIVPEQGGISALCTLALLNAGVAPGDPAMDKALEHLRAIDPQETYVLALQTMVFARAEPVKDVLLIRRNVRRLQQHQIESGECAGAWNYGDAGRGDNSNSQFALLALHEAERVGVETSAATWRRAYAYWQRCQNQDGSWGYLLQLRAVPGAPAHYDSEPGTGSMTCAGITSLVIAADRVRPRDAKAEGNRITCCLPHDSDDTEKIDRGLEWLGSHFSVARNPGHGFWRLYYLYGLERAGRLTARRFLSLPARAGRTQRRADWYREGTQALVEAQDSLSGYWTGTGPGENEPLIGTSFALLFLSKGRWPVLMTKLQHGDGDDWNHHRSDVANLTRYVESRWRRDLTWQVVELEKASVEDLIQTPVLYFCGSQDPLPDEPRQRKELAQKLRDYIDRGGFLFAEGYCGGETFDAGFRELMRLVFPEPEYKLRLLELEHPIWYAEEKIVPEQTRPVWGIESGCRTSVVYVPPDPPRDPRPSLSCLWELSRPGREEKYTSAVQAQIDAALSLGLNVLAYATNRELDPKEMAVFHHPAANHSDDRVEHGRLEVATLRHPGGCNSAPRALANLMDAAAQQPNVGPHFRPHAREEPLDITDDALFHYILVFMHGRTAFHLTAAERRRLKEYIERGGTLMADSICASQAFTDSFRSEMAAIFPDHKLEPIPASDPLLGTTYGGFDLRTVSRRDPEAAPTAGRPLEATTRKVPPELEGINFRDHWGVIFSPIDISCALEKHDSLECRGYTREDAARIGINVLRYACP